MTPDEAETLRGVADFMQDGADSLPESSAIGRELAAFADKLAAAVERRQRESRPTLRLVEDQLIGPDTSTWDIGLSYRSQLRLGRAGFKTLADLTGATDQELLAIEYIGPKSVELIRAALAGLARLDQEGGE
jgi:DNA-directed RNA polymerase alpha subunit